MSKQTNTSEVLDRLVVLERAVAEMTARVGELTSAIAEVAQLTGPSDPAGMQQLAIGADDISPFAVGFYQREYDSSDRAYRWTGKSSLFEFRIRINRNFDWTFTMELQRNRHVNISNLRGFVDYIEIPIQANEADGYIRGVIPPKPLGSSAVLTFQLPNLFVPNQINPESPDNRTLGVVFYEFRAEAGFAESVVSTKPAALRGSPESRPDSGDGKTVNPASRERRSLAASVSRLKISI
jgi:hypothetical protein